MLNNHDIVCLSSIDWDFIWQGHQEIMLRLARAGNRVLFIENTGARAPRLQDLPRLRQRWHNWRSGVYGIRQVEQGVYVYAPLVLPFPYARWARWMNRWLMHMVLKPWMRTVGFRRPVAWVFLPTPLSLDLLRWLDPILTIYYCIDRFTSSSSSAKKVARAERQLIRQADLVFVTSHALQQHCAQWNSRVHHFPFGVDLELFEAAGQQQGTPLPEDLERLPAPRIGYVGGLHQWVDQALLRTVAQQHRDYSFVLVGPIQTDVSHLNGVANVHFLGSKTHQELPHYIRGFDVCLIPYQLTDYTRHVYPTKLSEYFALGRPVVSTALPEVEAIARQAQGSILIGREPDEFSRHVASLVRDGHGDAQALRQAVARANSWSSMLVRMTELIEETLAIQWRARESSWTEQFRTLARMAMRRLVNILGAAVLAYALLFHTPLMWWMAAPLKITHAPDTADAIVVFAGGMGESGQAGQGYEERVQQAVELYHAGYASRLLLVSGYLYTMHEASVMRALAMSLGVPPEAIEIEIHPANTYESVVWSTRTLRAWGADRILFVSSPYHMRRALLVWRSQAPDIEVLCTPRAVSAFYGDGRRVTLHHLRAIVHEYAGLLYYRWRGYWR